MKINRIFKLLTLSGLSIQQRLPILVCLLLCSVILTFSFISYYGVKKAAINIGETRIRAVTDQLGTMFVKSSHSLNTSLSRLANNDTIKTFLFSEGTQKIRDTELILRRIQKDSTWVLVELLNAKRNPIFQSGHIEAGERLRLNTIFSDIQNTSDTTNIGKVYAVDKTTMYYPIVTRISDQGKSAGYIIVWKLLTSNQQKIKELSQLLGTGAILYIGNSDGSLWTNLLHPVTAPPVNLNSGE